MLSTVNRDHRLASRSLRPLGFCVWQIRAVVTLVVAGLELPHVVHGRAGSGGHLYVRTNKDAII